MASFLHGSLNLPGGFGILTCGIVFGTMCRLTHATFNPSSRHFPWGGEVIFLFEFVKCFTLCFSRLITGHEPGLAGKT